MPQGKTRFYLKMNIIGEAIASPLAKVSKNHSDWIELKALRKTLFPYYTLSKVRIGFHSSLDQDWRLSLSHKDRHRDRAHSAFVPYRELLIAFNGTTPCHPWFNLIEEPISTTSYKSVKIRHNRNRGAGQVPVLIEEKVRSALLDVRWLIRNSLAHCRKCKY